MQIEAFAPAKVNLYLHITGRRADGYHLVDSLVAFADIGDRVIAEPADGFSLAVNGPEASGLASAGNDNLVLRAARLLAAHLRIAGGAKLRLEKHLPVAAGIGGGSSDAAATLRVLQRLWRVVVDDAKLQALAGGRLRTGANPHTPAQRSDRGSDWAHPRDRDRARPPQRAARRFACADERQRRHLLCPLRRSPRG